MTKRSNLIKPLQLILLSLLCFARINMAIAGIRDDAPKIVDPFQGIIQRDGIVKNNKLQVDGIGNMRVAVVLSENTLTHMNWSESSMGGRNGADRFFGALFGGQSMLEESDRIHRESFSIKSITDAAIKPLVAAAKAVTVVQDLGEFKEGPYDLAVVIDITFIHEFSDGFIIGGSYITGTFMRAYFFDRALTMGPVIEVGRKKNAERNRFLFEIGELRQEVFTEYRTKVSGVLPKLPLAPPTIGSAERLNEVADLQKRGLISEEEAAAKKKKILDDI